MFNSTQEQFIVKELKTKGKINRNLCLKNYISRLGAHIKHLEKKGWEFKQRGYDENFDYFYYVSM